MNYGDLFLATLPETVLEIAALLVLVVDLGVLRHAARATRMGAAALLGVMGCAVALLAIPLQPRGGFSYAGVGDVVLAGGGAATIAQVGILVLTVLTLFLLIDAKFTRHPAEFVSVALMAAAGGMLIAAAQDLLVIFIGLELLSLGLYILTAFAKTSGKSAEAAIKYYLFGGMSAAFLLFGFSYLYGFSGSTNLHRIVQAAYAANAIQAMPMLCVALVMVAAGLGFKIAAAPFHLWAPDAYEGAPAPAAAFIASVSKVASFGLLISIGIAMVNAYVPDTHFSVLVPVHEVPRWLGLRTPWGVTLTLMAVASMLIGNLVALAQTSVRRLLAYSTVAHAGYMLLGLAFFSYGTLSANAILYYVLTYGLTTIGAFGVVGVVERATGSDRMDAFSGLYKRNPLLAGVLLVLFLSLAGIPPLVGFWAKFNLFAAVLRVNRTSFVIGLVALAVAMSAVSLYYYLQVLKRAYVTLPVEDTRIKAHPVTMAVLLLIAVAVVVLGCFPALLQDWMASFYVGI
jgi:NADH-quinone oxidoreductase subunit N